LNPNVTALFQPMNLGVFKILKLFYWKRFWRNAFLQRNG